jgi:hypothetical protein
MTHGPQRATHLLSAIHQHVTSIFAAKPLWGRCLPSSLASSLAVSFAISLMLTSLFVCSCMGGGASTRARVVQAADYMADEVAMEFLYRLLGELVRKATAARLTRKGVSTTASTSLQACSLHLHHKRALCVLLCIVVLLKACRFISFGYSVCPTEFTVLEAFDQSAFYRSISFADGPYAASPFALPDSWS